MRDTDTTGARLLRASQRAPQAWVVFREDTGHGATRSVHYNGRAAGVATRYVGVTEDCGIRHWWELRLNAECLTPQAHERLRGARFRTQRDAARWVRMNIKPIAQWS